MIPKRNKSLLLICGFLLICLLVHLFSTSLQGSEKVYEVRPEIVVPEYKTDLARIIEAYERLMNNYINLTEENYIDFHAELNEITRKIDVIDQRTNDLSLQIETIQKKLGIEVPVSNASKSKKSSSHITTNTN